MCIRDRLTPENAALSANGQATINGYLAEAGGSAGINYTLSNTSTGATGGQGSLGLVNCQRSISTLSLIHISQTSQRIRLAPIHCPNIQWSQPAAFPRLRRQPWNEAIAGMRQLAG